MSVLAWATGRSRRWWRLLGAFVPPGVGVDVDDVAALDETVDEGADTGGAREDGAPVYKS
jgi:hypothetical protein